MSKRELIELLTELLGPLSGMVLRQIDKFVRQGLTYKEIARAVYFLFDVQGRDKKSVSTYGIGLVPNVIKEANYYYDSLKAQQEKQAQQAQNFKGVPLREVKVQKRNKKKRSIDINEL